MNNTFALPLKQRRKTFQCMPLHAASALSNKKWLRFYVSSLYNSSPNVAIMYTSENTLMNFRPYATVQMLLRNERTMLIKKKERTVAKGFRKSLKRCSFAYFCTGDFLFT